MRTDIVAGRSIINRICVAACGCDVKSYGGVHSDANITVSRSAQKLRDIAAKTK